MDTVYLNQSNAMTHKAVKQNKKTIAFKLYNISYIIFLLSDLDTWSFIPPMKTKRCRLGLAGLNGKLYAAGFLFEHIL